MDNLKSLDNLIENLYKLPGVGKKSAERMAYSLLDFSDDDLQDIAKSISELKSKIHICPICGMITDIDGCYICDDKNQVFPQINYIFLLFLHKTLSHCFLVCISTFVI